MPTTANIPELLLPAGGFDSALAAIEGGADALYLGFADFSARKQAKNFDRLEYRRLFRLARDRGIRLYAALNTVILQAELEDASSLLAFLGRFPPDAVIVQDWGLARLIRDRHPGIAIHASTQTAVQGAGAARIARELGATRIVLPRETSLAEMAALRAEAPELEYETFVHGALCYSFSGLCLASGLVLGRSGNRGECAQLCRSYYRTEDRPADGGASGCPSAAPSGSPASTGSPYYGRTGFWFSCRDLDLGDRLGELSALGIASLKVEGRMKSPEYCFAVASLYRGLLDRLAAAKPGSGLGAGPSDEEIASRREAAKIAFARAPTQGWIEERGGAELIDSGYPGHRGVSAGRIVSNRGGRLVLDLVGPLGLRDGLLGFEQGDPSRPQRFPVLELRDPVSGREIYKAGAGSRVEFLAESEGRPCLELRPGDELRRISSRDLDRRQESPEEYEPARQGLSLKLHFSRTGIDAELEEPRFDALTPASAGEGRRIRIAAGEGLSLDRAKKPGGLGRALALFEESGEADFRLHPVIDVDAIVALDPVPDGSPRSCPVSELFIPPSQFKREKNRIYACAADIVEGAEIAYALASLATFAQPKEPEPEGLASVALEGPAKGSLEAPLRAALVFPREGLPSGLPFASGRDLVHGTDLPSWGGRFWLPLAPLVADREGYAALVEARVLGLLAAGDSLVLGLGALHHFELARRLLFLAGDASGHISFFLDINLYVANVPAYLSLSALLPRVEFAYRYLEIPAGPEYPSIPLAPVGPGFEPPLFQSLGCFLKHHITRGGCPPSCGRAWSGALADRDRRYRVLVEDCVTSLYRIGAERKVNA